MHKQMLYTVFIIGFYGSLCTSQIFAQTQQESTEAQMTTATTSNKVAANAIYLEAGGYGVIGGSLNYERFFSSILSLRLGVLGGGLPLQVGAICTLNFFPGRFSGDKTSGNAEFDIGFAPTIVQDLDNGIQRFYTPLAACIGYRFQPFDGGVMFRISGTVLYYTEETKLDGRVLPFIGVSLGYTF